FRRVRPTLWRRTYRVTQEARLPEPFELAHERLRWDEEHGAARLVHNASAHTPHRAHAIQPAAPHDHEGDVGGVGGRHDHDAGLTRLDYQLGSAGGESPCERPLLILERAFVLARIAAFDGRLARERVHQL